MILIPIAALCLVRYALLRLALWHAERRTSEAYAKLALARAEQSG